MLETLTISLNYKLDFPQNWPKSLTNLSFSARKVKLEISTLPPNLISLCTTCETLKKSAVNDVFPRSLTHLDFTFFELASDCNLLLQLPIGLRTLTLSSSHCRLTGLFLGAKTTLKNAIALLPPRLTKLKWPMRAPHDREMLLSLPQTLTWLENATVAPEDFDALPRSLTCFDASNYEKSLRKLEISSLPPGLKQLSLSVSALAGFDPNVDVSVLVGSTRKSEHPPRSCTSLSPNITSLEFALRKLMPHPMVLPHTLRSLKLSGSLTTHQVSLLPRALQQLELHAIAISWDVVAWARLPPALTRLHLLTVKALPVESSAHIPTNLRSLTLRTDGPVQLAWIEGLPDSLQELECYNLALTDTDSPKMRFPSSLLRLTLCMQCSVGLDETGNAKRNSSLIPKILCSLPPTLEKLNISANKAKYLQYSISHLYRLPSRLRILQLPITEGGCSSRPLTRATSRQSSSRALSSSNLHALSIIRALFVDWRDASPEPEWNELPKSLLGVGGR